MSPSSQLSNSSQDAGASNAPKTFMRVVASIYQYQGFHSEKYSIFAAPANDALPGRCLLLKALPVFYRVSIFGGILGAVS